MAYRSSTPAGFIDKHGGITAPDGYLICDGSAVSRTVYAALFANISCIWGVGDGATTFNLPDLRGNTLRGADYLGTLDPDYLARTAWIVGTFNVTGDTQGTNVLINLSSTANIAPGQAVTDSASDLPVNTYVQQILSPTSVQLNNPASGSNPGQTITFTNSSQYGVGSFQNHQFYSHVHSNHGTTTGGGGGNHTWWASDNPDIEADTDANGGNETRGLNSAALLIIKY
jgi:microcystin-dependent protein